MAALSQDYVRAVEAMASAAAEWMLGHPGDPPAFALGPKDVLIIGTLANVEGDVCRNRAARKVCAVMRQGALGVNGVEPTIFMFACALDYLGVKVERVGLGELGFVLGSS